MCPSGTDLLIQLFDYVSAALSPRNKYLNLRDGSVQTALCPSGTDLLIQLFDYVSAALSLIQLFVYVSAALSPRNKYLNLRDGSVQTIVPATTLKLQIKLTVLLGHCMLTPSRPVQGLTLQQAPGRVSTSTKIKSLVPLNWGKAGFEPRLFLSRGGLLLIGRSSARTLISLNSC